MKQTGTRLVYSALVASLLLIAALVLPAIIVSREVGCLCIHTGSLKGHTDWFFGLRTHEWHKSSELEKFLRSRRSAEAHHHWVTYRGTGRDVFGFMRSSAHGRPGPMMRTVFTDLFDPYVLSLSDAEKLQLHDLLRSEDEDAIAWKLDEVEEWCVQRGTEELQ